MKMSAAEITRLIGVPYRNRGRSPQDGFDCYGLVEFVLREHFGVRLPDYSAQYADSAIDNACTIEDLRARDWQPVADAPRAGDVVLLRIGGSVRHMGVMHEPPLMLHCLEGRGTTCERIDSVQWRHRVAGFYRRA